MSNGRLEQRGSTVEKDVHNVMIKTFSLEVIITGVYFFIVSMQFQLRNKFRG